MAYTLKGFKAGRSWTVDRLNETGSGAANIAVGQVERTYIIERGLTDVAWSEADETTMQGVLSLLPKIGDVHHASDPLLQCSGIRFSEGTGSDRLHLYATVTYSRQSPEQPATQQGETACMVEQWGWRSGTVQRDLMDWSGQSATPATGAKPIVNSAGDPFDSVPQIDWPSPTFTKVFKTKTRLAGVSTYASKVNDASITIGGVASASRQLRVVQCDEERIFQDPLGYKYRYTIALQRMSNEVQIYDPDTGSITTMDIGWDVAVADMGLRALQYPGGGGAEVAMRITDEDANGEKVPVSTPVGLDGTGHRSTDGNPVFLMFKTYKAVTIPSIFYSEPT